MSNPTRPRRERKISVSGLFASFLFLGLLPTTTAYTTNRYFANNAGTLPRPARWGPPEKRDSVPLIISNQCEATIWPGIGTQAGTGAGTGGFELDPGSSKSLMVSADWQGRVWGRTNCSFNAAGTGASNLNGNNGGGAACTTGDCGGVLSCVLTVSLPLDSKRWTLTDTSRREQRLSLLRNLILLVVPVTIKLSTISPWSTDTTFP